MSSPSALSNRILRMERILEEEENYNRRFVQQTWMLRQWIREATIEASAGTEPGVRKVLILDCLGRPWNDSWNIAGELYDSSNAIVSSNSGNTANGWLSFPYHNASDDPVTIQAGGQGCQSQSEPFVNFGTYQIQVQAGYVCFSCGLYQLNNIRSSSDQNTFAGYDVVNTRTERTRVATVVNLTLSGGVYVCGTTTTPSTAFPYWITLDADPSGTPRATIVMWVCSVLGGTYPASSYVYGQVSPSVTQLTAQVLATSFACAPDTDPGSFTATFDFAGTSVAPYIYPSGSTQLTLSG